MGWSGDWKQDSCGPNGSCFEQKVRVNSTSKRVRMVQEQMKRTLSKSSQRKLGVIKAR